MYIVFYSTSDVFETEEIFDNNGIECKVVPTPVTDKAYCGVCLQVEQKTDLSFITDYEYEVIEEICHV